MAAEHYILRYYGSLSADGKTSAEHTRAVCSSSPAVCIDLAIGECVKTPIELAAPYSERRSAGAPFQKHEGLPHEGLAGDGYIILRKASVQSRLEMWSGCQSGCGDCLNGTGYVLDYVASPGMCKETAQNTAFYLIESSSFLKPKVNCVESLKESSQEYNKSDPTLGYIIIVMVVGIVVVLVLLVYLLLACVCRVKYSGNGEESRAAERNASQLPAITSGEINRLFPAIRAAEAPPNMNAVGAACVICLVPIAGDERCRVLNCEHVFHANCVATWWVHQPRQSLSCPTCRAPQHIEPSSWR